MQVLRCKCILCSTPVEVTMTDATADYILEHGAAAYANEHCWYEHDLNPPEVDTMVITKICPECMKELAAGVPIGLPGNEYIGKCDCGRSLFKRRDMLSPGRVKCLHCTRQFTIAYEYPTTETIEIEEIEDD